MSYTGRPSTGSKPPNSLGLGGSSTARVKRGAGPVGAFSTTALLLGGNGAGTTTSSSGPPHNGTTAGFSYSGSTAGGYIVNGHRSHHRTPGQPGSASGPNWREQQAAQAFALPSTNQDTSGSASNNSTTAYHHHGYQYPSSARTTTTTTKPHAQQPHQPMQSLNGGPSKRNGYNIELSALLESLDAKDPSHSHNSHTTGSAYKSSKHGSGAVQSGGSLVTSKLPPQQTTGGGTGSSSSSYANKSYFSAESTIARKASANARNRDALSMSGSMGSASGSIHQQQQQPQSARARVSSSKPRPPTGSSSARGSGTASQHQQLQMPTAASVMQEQSPSLSLGSDLMGDLGLGQPDSTPVPQEPRGGNSITSAQVAAHFETQMSRYERTEVHNYPTVYFLGLRGAKVDAPVPNAANFGFDDERGDYVVVKHDHIAYRYEVLGDLGKGSFGQVLKVTDHKTNTTAALKIIRNKKRFHQQAQVEVRILDHLKTRDVEERSCTVVMVDHFNFRNHMCIVFPLHSMNLYELAKLNKYQPFAPALIKRFAAQLLVSLSFMWRERIIHCDLKPENILLRTESKTTIRVIDFGSSCFEHERVFTYIQSRFYRAPEIMFGMSYGRPIDLWSFGCIVCEMALGYPIFPGENEQEQLLCIMEVLGVPPPKLVEKAPRKKQFFDAQGQPRIVPNSRNKVRKPSTKELKQVLRTDDDSFIDFLLLFLRWDPSDRVTPLDAMAHPYIAECFHQPVSSKETSKKIGATSSSTTPNTASAESSSVGPSSTNTGANSATSASTAGAGASAAHKPAPPTTAPPAPSSARQAPGRRLPSAGPASARGLPQIAAGQMTGRKASGGPTRPTPPSTTNSSDIGPVRGVVAFPSSETMYL